jgi:hypothetical protein
MRTLETAAGQAGPGRDQAWREAVIVALVQLLGTLTEQQATYEDPASLMAQVAQDEPRLRTWVRQLQRRGRELADSTRDQMEALQAAEAPSVADVREQLRWLLSITTEPAKPTSSLRPSHRHPRALTLESLARPLPA